MTSRACQGDSGQPSPGFPDWREAAQVHDQASATRPSAGQVPLPPRLDCAVAQRWRNILIGEQIAARVLVDADLPVAEATIHEQDDRCFLEIPRFDLVGTLAGTRYAQVRI